MWNHYVIPFLLPPGINIAIIIFAWMIRLFKPFLSRFLVLVSLATLYLFSTPMFTVYFAHHFEKYSPLNVHALPANMQAIVVFGPWKDLEMDSITPMNGQALNRIHYAKWLHQKTKLPVYLITRKPTQELNSRDSLFIKNLLDMESDIPVSQIVNSEGHFWQDSNTLAQEIAKRKLQRIYLISESWHMPQALLGFEREHIQVIPAPIAFISDRFKHQGVQAYFPHAEALSASSILIYESIRYYWMRLVGPASEN